MRCSPSAIVASLAVFLLAVGGCATSQSPQPREQLANESPHSSTPDQGRRVLIAEDLTQVKHFLQFKPSQGKWPAVESLLSNRCSVSRLTELDDDVSGPVDSWYRSSLWMTRDAVRFGVSPAELRLAAASDRATQLRRELDLWKATFSELGSAEVLRAVRQSISEPLVLNALSPADISSPILAGAFDPLGDELLSAYDAGGNKEARASRLAVASNQLLFETTQKVAFSGNLDRLRQTTSSALPSQIDSAPTLDRQEQLDRLVAVLSFFQEVASAQEETASRALALLHDKASATRVWEFDERLTGPWDSLVTIWRTGGSSEKILKEMNDGFQIYVLSDADLEEFRNDVERIYDKASRTSAKRMFDLSTSSPKSYPTASRIEAKRVTLALDPARAVDTTWLRSQILVDAPVLPLTVVDSALIIGGLMGAPESGGTTLVVSAVGAVHFAFQTVHDSMATIRHHVRRTTLLSVTHSTIASEVLGTSANDNVVVAKAVLVPQTDIRKGWCAALNHSLSATLPAYMDGIFGKEQP